MVSKKRRLGEVTWWMWFSGEAKVNDLKETFYIETILVNNLK